MTRYCCLDSMTCFPDLAWDHACLSYSLFVQASSAMTQMQLASTEGFLADFSTVVISCAVCMPFLVGGSNRQPPKICYLAFDLTLLLSIGYSAQFCCQRRNVTVSC